ncbi:MAG: hypothetical protein QXN37_03310 [Candidatus Anstonellaceae archaeon]
MGNFMFTQPQDKAKEETNITKNLERLEKQIYEKKAVDTFFVQDVQKLYVQAKKENHQQAIAFCEKVLQFSGLPPFSTFAKDKHWITFYDVYFKIIELISNSNVKISHSGAQMVSQILTDFKHKNQAPPTILFKSKAYATSFIQILEALQDIVPMKVQLEEQNGEWAVNISSPQSSVEESKQPIQRRDSQTFQHQQTRINLGSSIISLYPQQFSDEELLNRTDNILFSMAEISGAVNLAAHRQHATHYKHSTESEQIAIKSFYDAILLCAKQLKLETDGYGSTERFISMHKDDLIKYLEENNTVIYSSATVEKIYSGQISWEEVKEELEKNLKVAKDYADKFDSLIKQHLGIERPIVLDLNLLQEIPENVRNQWLTEKDTSPELRAFLQNQYSDERVRENRLRVFGVVYYDAMKEQKGKSQQEINALKKDKNSATYTYEKLKEAVKFHVNERGDLLDVEIINNSYLNELLSLRRGGLRWMENGEGSYFDNAIALSSKDGFWGEKLKEYGLPPTNMSNRMLGFAIGAGQTLSIQIVDFYDEAGQRVEKVEPGKTYKLKLSVLHNEKTPTLGSLKVRVFDGLTENGRELETEKGEDGYFYATYSIPPVYKYEAIKKISFIAEYNIGDLSSGKVVYHHTNEEKKEEQKPSKLTDLPPDSIFHVMPNVRQEIPITIPLFAPSLPNYERLNSEIQNLVSNFGGRLNEEKGTYEGITLRNEKEVRQFTDGLKQSLRNWVDVSFDQMKGQLKAGTTKEQLLNLIDNNSFEQIANLMVEGSPLKTAFETYRNTIQGALAAAVVLFDLLKHPSFVVSADAEFLNLFQKQDPASHQNLSLHVYVNLATNKIVLSNENPTRFLSSNEGFYLAYTLQTKGFSLRTNVGVGHTGVYTSNLRPIDQFFVFTSTGMGLSLTNWLKLNIGLGVIHKFAGSSFIEVEQVPINFHIDKNSILVMSAGVSGDFGDVDAFAKLVMQIESNNSDLNKKKYNVGGRFGFFYKNSCVEVNANKNSITFGVKIYFR